MRKADYRGTVGQRFWAKVEQTEGCWNWQAATMKRNGYGVFAKTLAHRFSYQFNVGEIPKEMHVLHRCDNPRCVRPDHLFLGTQKENMHDMISKGRDMNTTKPHTHVRGAQVGGAKLTEQKVFQLRRIKLKGCNIRRIARWIKMDSTGVSKMLSGENWRHVLHPISPDDTYDAANKRELDSF